MTRSSMDAAERLSALTVLVDTMWVQPGGAPGPRQFFLAAVNRGIVEEGQDAHYQLAATVWVGKANVAPLVTILAAIERRQTQPLSGAIQLAREAAGR